MYFKKKQRKSPERPCKQPRSATPVIIGTVNWTLYPLNTATWYKLKGTRCFTEVILSIYENRKEVMARCLLDIGCTKSMILKKCTDQKRQPELSDKDSLMYETYGSSFKSSMIALDISLGFYLIPFDEESQKICSTILPWGKYSYLRMPMSVSSAPSMFQLIMMETLRGLDVLVYIDDIFVIQR